MFKTNFQLQPSTKFVVKNISPMKGKTVRIFNYPILHGATRNLLAIPQVSEADIRHSLLKGELLIKLKYEELTVVDSDIDLLQFNDDQKSFLRSIGITKGLEIDSLSNDVSGYDFLLENNPDDIANTYTNIYDGNLVMQEIWNRNSDSTLLKTIDYTYSSLKVIQEVRKIYDTDGATIKAQLTYTYTYDGSKLIQAIMTRDI